MIHCIFFLSFSFVLSKMVFKGQRAFWMLMVFLGKRRRDEEKSPG